MQSQQVRGQIEDEAEVIVAIEEAAISMAIKTTAGVEDTAVEAGEEDEEGIAANSATWTELQNLSCQQFHRDRTLPTEAPSGVA